MKFLKFRRLPSFRTGISNKAGRNNTGRISVRHRGAGHKQLLRPLINFSHKPSFSNLAGTRRSQEPNNVEGVFVGYEYDPQRTTPLAKIFHQSKSTFSYSMATEGLKPLQKVSSFVTNPTKQGDVSQLGFFEVGDFVHSVEFFPGQGPKIGRSAGSFCQIRSKARNTQTDTAATAGFVELVKSKTKRPFVRPSERSQERRRKVRLPSGSQRIISSKSSATLGMPELNEYRLRPIGKAGRSR